MLPWEFLKMNDRLKVILYEYIFQKESYYKNLMITRYNRLFSKHCSSDDIVAYLLACRDYETFQAVFRDVSELLKMFK